ncbi:MAG TPA: tRNA (adenosine(37)-N6)-threonylcarbamoyltransferase complex dimerization subunit type 1 TsaB [Acidobacteriaceae bacterium]|nr:tRNA (adenosine(37)-N6)-threonylcarbamoyltransferase complex dimerization subunit type 1 TsaB [Acidobacteriaceae bacterium]
MPDSAATAPMLLALDTCGAAGSVVLGRVRLAENKVEVLARAEFAGRTYSAQLIPRIGELLAGQHATMRDIRAIVAVRGPGSFTGVRVGLSAAKGLAEGSGSGIIAVSRLALLASVSGLPHVLAAINAGRGEYYVGEYREGGVTLRETLMSAAELCAAVLVPGAGVLVCESSELQTGVAGALGEAIGAVPGRLVYVPAPDASDALLFALNRLRSEDFEDVEALDGNYLRRSDAELFGAAGTGVRKAESTT